MEADFENAPHRRHMIACPDPFPRVVAFWNRCPLPVEIGSWLREHQVLESGKKILDIADQRARLGQKYPLESGVLDAVIETGAPFRSLWIDHAEIHRVLKPAGLWVLIESGNDIADPQTRWLETSVRRCIKGDSFGPMPDPFRRMEGKPFQLARETTIHHEESGDFEQVLRNWMGREDFVNRLEPTPRKLLQELIDEILSAARSVDRRRLTIRYVTRARIYARH